MIPLLKCAMLPQDEPQYPFVFIDLQNVLCSGAAQLWPSIETYNVHGSEVDSPLGWL